MAFGTIWKALYPFINLILCVRIGASISNGLSTNLIDKLHINFIGMIHDVDEIVTHLTPVDDVKKMWVTTTR